MRQPNYLRLHSDVIRVGRFILGHSEKEVLLRQNTQTLHPRIFPMKQMTLVDAESAGKHKRYRKELILIEMDRVAPLKAWIAQLKPPCPKGEGGRPACPLSAMPWGFL